MIDNEISLKLNELSLTIRRSEANQCEIRRLSYIVSRKEGAHIEQCAHAAWVAREMARVSRSAAAAADLARDLFFALALPAYTREQAEILWNRIQHEAFEE
jgi:hypothetical protein